METTVRGLVLSGGVDTNAAKCLACGWTGTANEMYAVAFGNPFINDDEALNTFCKDVLMAVAKECAEPLGRVLIKWGFMVLPIDKQAFGKYLTYCSQMIAQSFLETRKQIELEKGQPRDDK